MTIKINKKNNKKQTQNTQKIHKKPGKIRNMLGFCYTYGTGNITYAGTEI